ncbi:alpha-ketoacid dehydrogenase subunit beta [bacterium]|nr:alpha-ketoacid dehydrogenase subunit beta [bacterium]
MSKLNMVQAINLALQEKMKDDDGVVVLGEDVGVDEGVFRVTAGLLEKYGEERVIDTPLAESGIIGTSIGMALTGMKPVCEMQFSGFSYLIMHQLEGHASRMRQRSLGAWSVPLVVRMPYGGGIRALEHHSESRETFYAHIPGIKTVIPSSPRNARALLVSAIEDPDPVIFMEPKRSYRAFREDVPDKIERMELGKAQIVQEGNDITVISWGAMMRPVIKAIEESQKEFNASIELIDILTVSPLDEKAIIDSVMKTGRVVIVQEAPKNVSISSEIVARINDKALLYLEAPVKRVTNYDVVTPYFSRELDFIPSQGRIKRAIKETLDF